MTSKEKLQAEADARNLAAIDLAPEDLLPAYFALRAGSVVKVKRESLTVAERRLIADLCRRAADELSHAKTRARVSR